MRANRLLPFVAATLIAACQDEPLISNTPDAPPAPTHGVQAFVQVDNDHAQPGERVHVYVRVQFGTETPARLGSYTGRLRFDPEALGWQSDVDINDNALRVINPNGAAAGDVRFAGASAAGINDHTLYQGVFEVKKAGYMEGLRLEMEELSAAGALTNLKPDLRVAPQVFLRRVTP